ncbi:MAG: sensor histidine kinase KdpD [Leptospiraceae bacterium]|nr:sensor histidine kinase KdpD [Leptospiraceae bacterium]
MTPEDFLRIAETENPSSKKGRLKVFFGMCPGVGKTYAMLAEAQRLQTDGNDIVVGIIETHGRKETLSLTEGLNAIPPKTIHYKGKDWKELNLEAILERKPEIVLIDELAHSNIPGSFHEKRYQDILEILKEGINVYSTLNVQHIESQVDSVEKIVGFRITETVPDSVIDIADEIVLIDIIPTELIRRLKDGKVYFPEKIEQSQENFFKIENLIYLRELSLNYTALHVDRGMPQGKERILVALSNSPYSKNLLRHAKRIAIERRCELFAVFIETSQGKHSENKIVRANIELAKQLGAEIIHRYSDDPAYGILETAKDIEATKIVFGKSLNNKILNLFRKPMSSRLLESDTNFEMIVIPVEREHKPKFADYIISFYPKSRLINYFAIFPSLILVTLFNLSLLSIVGYWTISLFYLIYVATIGIFFSRGPTLLAAFLSALLWNFLYIPPRFTFFIYKLEDLLMFFVFMGIALIIGSLTSKLKRREGTLKQREEGLHLLFNLTANLSKSSLEKNIVESGEEFVTKILKCKVQIFLIRDSRADFSKLGVKERAIAEWVWKNEKPAGKFTDTLNWNELTYIPLMSTEKTVGILMIHGLKEMNLEIEVLLNTVLKQITMALERERLAEESKQAYLLQESEKIYSVLFDSLSHELKTPLTSISGSATALMDKTISENIQAREELLKTIQENAMILNLFVGNLLDISRIESGKISLKKEIIDIQDLWHDTQNLINNNNKHIILTRIPNSLPQIYVDKALISHALFNLLHNSCLYAPENSEITFIVEFDEARNKLRLILIDNGPGFLGDPTKIFLKFYREEGNQKLGTGLGLSISKSIIELHGGTIHAENIKPSGAKFTIEFSLQNISTK